MASRVAAIVTAATLACVATNGQEPVCDLFKDLKAADGRQVIVTGELILSEKGALLGASGCDYQYLSPIDTSRFKIFKGWPTALRLTPSAAVPPAQVQTLRDAAAKANLLRREGKTVSASAIFSGRLRLGHGGQFPAELTFDSMSDLNVEPLPDAGTLPVIPICELFQNLVSWKGQRIAVRGESVHTSEGSWIIGRCKGGFYTDGYRWRVALTSASPAYYSGEIAPFARPKLPSSAPKGEREFRGRHSVVETATYVGRLHMRDKYIAVCERGHYVGNGFGHLNGAAAELILEEVRDVELTRAGPNAEAAEEQSCQSPNVAELCAGAATLSQAASLGCTSRVTELLSNEGIDSKGGDESAALGEAIRRGDTAIVKLLLDAGAPVNPTKCRLWPPLEEAAHWDKVAVMKMLIKAGAKVDWKDRDGGTYLGSFGFFNTAVLKTLLDAGANPNATDQRGATALMHASSYGYEDAAVLLIKSGANVNQRDNRGRTALMYATASKYVDTIPHLLKAGADLYARDQDGKTALEIAAESKNEVASEMLEDAMSGR